MKKWLLPAGWHAALPGILLFLFVQCERRNQSEVIWDKNFSRIGSQSSPRVADLNGDGVGDIVIGAGQNEYQKSEQGVLALDGKSGEILWPVASEDQVYGAATLYDITGDGVADVFIGGRSPYFRALNGATGQLIWEYRYAAVDDPVMKHARFNFNNSVLVPDQNGDGLMDLLTSNGGNSKAAPYSSEDRFPGILIVFDSKSGNVIAADTMPDGRETYMSPLCFFTDRGKSPMIVFGSGGETLSGNLYRARLSDLVAGKLSAATVIASDRGHGFIAPPVIVDVNGDQVPDILAISHGSSAFAIDGMTDKLLWHRRIPATESSNSFAIGYFTDDDVPDVFTFVSKGKWPHSTGSLQVMLDGKNGGVAFMDSVGCTGFSSPVVYDLNNDGRDEVIISVNLYDCALGFSGESPRTPENKLLALDFHNRSYETIDQQQGFKNIFSTPWIGDLDNDGYLDIISCQYFHYGDLLNFMGMRMKRIGTPVRLKGAVLWGAYMGSNGDGIFPSVAP